MKNFINTYINLLLVALIITGCTSRYQLFTGDEYYSGQNGMEKARQNAITDFANTYKTPTDYLERRNGKPFDVFNVYSINLSKNIYAFQIGPITNNHLSLRINDRLGQVPESGFPNNVEVEGEKLFLWRDDRTILTRKKLDVIEEYIELDSTDIKRESGLLPDDFEDDRLLGSDERLKGVDYYICKSDI